MITDLSSSGVGSQQVDDLDTSDQDFSTWSLLDEWRSISVNGVLLLAGEGSSLIDGLSDDVHDTSKGLGTDWDSNGGT